MNPVCDYCAGIGFSRRIAPGSVFRRGFVRPMHEQLARRWVKDVGASGKAFHWCQELENAERKDG